MPLMSLGSWYLLAFLALTGGVTVFVFAWIRERQASRDRSRYELFALRDHFMWLVIEGTIDRHDPLFERYYDFVNTLVNHTDKCNLALFAELVLKADPLPGQATSFKKHLAKIRKKPKAFQEAINQIYDVIDKTMVRNSTIFRFLKRGVPGVHSVLLICILLRLIGACLKKAMGAAFRVVKRRNGDLARVVVEWSSQHLNNLLTEAREEADAPFVINSRVERVRNSLPYHSATA